MREPLTYQPLECSSSPVAKDSSTGEPVVIFAVRPDEPTPLDLGLNLGQAQRLLAATIFLLILLLCGLFSTNRSFDGGEDFGGRIGSRQELECQGGDRTAGGSGI